MISPNRIIASGEVTFFNNEFKITGTRLQKAFSNLSNEFNLNISPLFEFEKSLFIEYFQTFIPEVALIKDSGEKEKVNVVIENLKPPIILEFLYKEDEKNPLDIFNQNLKNLIPETMLFLRNLFLAENIIKRCGIQANFGTLISSAVFGLIDQNLTEINPYSSNGLNFIVNVWERFTKLSDYLITESGNHISFFITKNNETYKFQINIFNPFQNF